MYAGAKVDHRRTIEVLERNQTGIRPRLQVVLRCANDMYVF